VYLTIKFKMKKELLKSSYRLQVLKDGSAFYLWIHPWKSRFMVRSKDISHHSFWDKTKKSAESTQATHLQKYTKSFIPKQLTSKK
jgi:hypothetical protein